MLTASHVIAILTLLAGIVLTIFTGTDVGHECGILIVQCSMILFVLVRIADNTRR